MKIQIATSELLFQIRNKSSMDVALIPTEQRYKWEVGTEKMDEIHRNLIESYAVLQENLSRFLRLEEDLGDIESDTAILPEVLILDVENSGRRTAGRGQTLTDMCVSYITNATLSKFYITVSALDLAKKRADLADADLKLIMRLFYTKLARTVPTATE